MSVDDYAPLVLLLIVWGGVVGGFLAYDAHVGRVRVGSAHTWRLRLRAIYFALVFGLVPWWVYERTPHHAPWGYWRHLVGNLGIVWRWVTFTETAKDHADEARLNAGRPVLWPFVRCGRWDRGC